MLEYNKTASMHKGAPEISGTVGLQERVALRFSRQFRISVDHAMLAVRLAGIGPREARHG